MPRKSRNGGGGGIKKNKQKAYGNRGGKPTTAAVVIQEEKAQACGCKARRTQQPCDGTLSSCCCIAPASITPATEPTPIAPCNTKKGEKKKISHYRALLGSPPASRHGAPSFSSSFRARKSPSQAYSHITSEQRDNPLLPPPPQTSSSRSQQTDRSKRTNCLHPKRLILIPPEDHKQPRGISWTEASGYEPSPASSTPTQAPYDLQRAAICPPHPRLRMLGKAPKLSRALPHMEVFGAVRLQGVHALLLQQGGKIGAK